MSKRLPITTPETVDTTLCLTNTLTTENEIAQLETIRQTLSNLIPHIGTHTSSRMFSKYHPISRNSNSIPRHSLLTSWPLTCEYIHAVEELNALNLEEELDLQARFNEPTLPITKLQ